LCGGSNIDIDQQSDGRNRDKRPWGSWGNILHESSRNEHQGGAQRARPNGGVCVDVLSRYFGSVSPQQIVMGAVALFVALVCVEEEICLLDAVTILLLSYVVAQMAV
jgi:hypothetical protein